MVWLNQRSVQLKKQQQTKSLCWMVTLLLAVGLERITPKYIYFNARMLERTDAITNEVLEPVTFVPACPTV